MMIWNWVTTRPSAIGMYSLPMRRTAGWRQAVTRRKRRSRRPDQERGQHDDAEVEDRAAQGGVGEAPERIEQPGEATGEAEDKNGGRNDAQAIREDLLQLRVSEIAQQPCERPGEGLDEQDDDAHHDGNER
jgi:hypothetical protein